MPWDKWFPQDWLGDPNLSMCSPSTRGIWMDAICAMMLRGTDRVSGSNADLARVCRCSEADIEAAHVDLVRHDAGACSEQNGCKIWVNRRRARTLEIKELRKRAGVARWSKRGANAEHRHMQNVASSSSNSSYVCIQDVSEEPAFTLSQCQSAAASIGITAEMVEAFFHHYNGQGWRKANGQKITNLHSALATWKAQESSHGKRLDAQGTGRTTEQVLAEINERKARERQQKEAVGHD